MVSPRVLIENIRREKFEIGCSTKKPLAPDLHRTLKHLSVGQYANDMHFIREIIQNVEDNTYGEHVRPALEFLLTNEDVSKMGVPATLLVFNNETGLTSADVEALCSANKSTKENKRDKGYIGCLGSFHKLDSAQLMFLQGIGFKSVFVVSETPILISNGFRIRFQDAVCKEAGVGFIVPEWTETPTDAAILAACGRSKLPGTVMILPLRCDSVDLVRQQLKEISPENILFLSKIRELHIVDKSESGGCDSGGFLKITLSDPPISPTAFEAFPKISEMKVKVNCKMFKATLTVECDRAAQESDTFSYLVFQGLFPVTHKIVERKEVRDWAISLAFPLKGRASRYVGDIFSFLPTELRTGFPFIINADFILTSSRDTIRFDCMWNIGILNCIPIAFEIAFSKMILDLPSRSSNGRYLSDRRDAYRFLPVNMIENAYRYSSTCSPVDRQVRQKLDVQPEQASNIRKLEEVRAEIFRRLRKKKLIFVSSPGMDNGKLQLAKDYGLPASSCLQIKKGFREILKCAAQNKHPAPSVVLTLQGDSVIFGGGLGIVDEYVQDKYASGLKALGVTEMTDAQYIKFLDSDWSGDWLVNLPDKIYLQVLGFFALAMKLKLDRLRGLPLFKIRGSNGTAELYSFSSLNENELLYAPSVEDSDWIYKWKQEFTLWDDVEVMPAETSRTLEEACIRGNRGELMTWIRKHVSLTESSAKKYAQRMIQKLTITQKLNVGKGYPKFAILVLQFLYSGIHEKKLSREFVIQTIQNLQYVIVCHQQSSLQSSKDRRISRKQRGEKGFLMLLPREVSEWPHLFDFSNEHFTRLTALSDMYFEPQCSLVRNIVTKSAGENSMLEFIKDAFNAVDLLSIELLHDWKFPFHSRVTMERSALLIQWLKVFLPRRSLTKWERDHDCLFQSLKSRAWLKTYYHGWQLPTSVLYTVSCFENRWTAHDLPFLDVCAYLDAHLDLNDSATKQVFEDLGVVTDLRKGCAVILDHFSKLSAVEVDLDAVKRFYTNLSGIKSHFTPAQISKVKIWIPADVSSRVPVWKERAYCILCDKLGIFEDSNDISVLDKFYDESLLPFFAEVLKVQEKASVATYCKIWLEWSCVRSPVDEATMEADGCPRIFSCCCGAKVQQVLKEILRNWQDSNEEEDSKELEKAVPEKERFWNSFHSRGWVPVAPASNELVGDANVTVSLVPPTSALIADTTELSTSFSEAANGNLNFVWMLPDVSAPLANLVEMYSKMGVRKLSELVTCSLNIPIGVKQWKIDRKDGLLCEGLFRIVLAYLCKNGEKYGLSITDRQQILFPLISTSESVVSAPFEKIFRLPAEAFNFLETTERNVYVYYDKVGGTLYHLASDDALVEKDDVSKKTFNTQFVGTVSTGILSEHPKLVAGLTSLLEPLCPYGFGMEVVELEMKKKKLVIFPEDEKLLMERPVPA